MKKTISVLLICALMITMFGTWTAFAQYDTSLPFTDIHRSHTSGYLNVKSLYEKGIMQGKTETTFAPFETLTREEVAKIIVLASGAPLVSGSGRYSDVVAGSWYEVYVETAATTELMNGIGDGLFGVGSKVSRQDAAVLAARMANYRGIKLQDITPYNIVDISSASDYAVSSIQALVNMNVADLNQSGGFDPLSDITRLEFCKYVDRILNSSDTLYDDYLDDWRPNEPNIEELDSEVVAFEDFENGLTTLDSFEESIKGVGDAMDYIVTETEVSENNVIKLTGESDGYSEVDLYLRDVTPGVDYFFSWDIKTENLGEDCFARINFEWYSANGKLWGSYERNADIYGDNDWTKQSFAYTAPTPDTSPKFLRVAITVRGATTGSICIDNLKIYKVVYEPLTTYLKKPAYKGIITDPNGEGDIRVTSYIKGLGAVYNPDEYHVVASVSDFQGRNYMSSAIDQISEEMDVTFSSKNLAVGDYDLSVKFVENETGRICGENHWIIRKRDKDFTTKYSFDEYGRFLKNGKPWFGIGSYALGLDEVELEDFKDTPIEFMIANSTGRFWTKNNLLQTAADYGLSLMISNESEYMDAMRGEYQNGDITNIASERVVTERMIDDLNLQDEAAHMGYQINNEFPAAKWADRLRWRNQVLSEIDLDHFTYGVGVGGKAAAIEYARCHDVYASDPYPITGAETDQIWQVYEDAKGLYEGTANRPIWTVVQISDLKVMGREPYLSRERGPNETELRNMAWQAVCAGSQGVIWYAHFHLSKETASRPKEETFAEVVRVSEELRKYEDVIMSVEDAPDVRLSSDIEDRFASLVRRHDGKTYVFLVNMSKEKQNVNLYLDGASSVYGEYSKKNFAVGSGGKVTLSMDGLGVEILIVDQDDQPSPECEIRDVQFSDGENSYFIIRKDGENLLYIPEGADTLYYNVDTHSDARVIVNGCPNKSQGNFSIAQRDSVRFTVIAEDGQHWNQYWYKIVRTNGKE